MMFVCVCLNAGQFSVKATLSELESEILILSLLFRSFHPKRMSTYPLHLESQSVLQNKTPSNGGHLRGSLVHSG